jgi:hypothetical protein
MFNKKILLRFYLVGVPIMMILAFMLTNSPSTEDSFGDGPIQVTEMNSIAKQNYEEAKAAYAEEQAGEARSKFWWLMGAGIIWIAIAYVIFMVFRRIYKSKK